MTDAIDKILERIQKQREYEKEISEIVIKFKDCNECDRYNKYLKDLPSCYVCCYECEKEEYVVMSREEYEKIGKMWKNDE